MPVVDQIAPAGDLGDAEGQTGGLAAFAVEQEELLDAVAVAALPWPRRFVAPEAGDRQGRCGPGGGGNVTTHFLLPSRPAGRPIGPARRRHGSEGGRSPRTGGERGRKHLQIGTRVTE